MALERIWWPRQIPKRGLAFSDCRVLMEVVYSCRAELRVPRTIADEETVQLLCGMKEKRRREEGEKRETAKGSASRIKRKKW